MRHVTYYHAVLSQVVDDKGNHTEAFVKDVSFVGGYLQQYRLEQESAIQLYGLERKERVYKIHTRAGVEKNSFIYHKDTILHVLDVMELKGVNTLVVKEVR
jgi:hypothetical protein